MASKNLYAGMRHEIKILLSQAEYVSMAEKIKAICSPDYFSTATGDYFIRSLYFDDIYDTAYVTKVAGSDNRKKYRIRCYNLESDVIKFECKYKLKDRIKKTSFSITSDEFYKLLDGDHSFLEAKENPLAKEILGQITANGLKPAVIVDYDREAYVHPLSNVRLTFDKNLRAAFGSNDIFRDDLYTLPIFPNGSVIFEVKYDEFIPAHIVDILSTLRGEKMALSKYCMCREKVMEVKYYD